MTAGVEPKLTVVAPVKPVPVTVTGVPPPIGPAFGITVVTVAAGVKVKASCALTSDVPPGVLTVMSTVPAVSAGAMAVMEVLELIV